MSLTDIVVAIIAFLGAFLYPLGVPLPGHPS